MPAIGESSTGYTKSPEIGGVPERVAAVLPSVRLIYLIRNPVERIRSMYVHEVARSRETRDLGRAIKRRASYLDFTRYGHQLDLYLSVFPREQILILRSEDLLVHRRETVASVFEFLGVEAKYRVNGLEVEHNTSDKQRRYHPALRRMKGVLRPLRATTMVPAPVRNRMRPALARPVAARSLRRGRRGDLGRSGR